MKSMLRTLLFTVLFACVSSMAAMTTTDITPGKVVSGPPLSAKDLKGKVVLVLYWGTH